MKILSGAQMARWDRLSIRKHGISALGLMRRAAAGCAAALLAQPAFNPGKSVVVVCGPGNNGGDGMAIAWLLSQRGFAPRVFFLGDAERLSPEARYFHERVQPWLTDLRSNRGKLALKKALRGAAAVIDALFGIGLKRPLTGLFLAAVRAMNAAPGFKLAVDIPSGLDADSGEILGAAFRADLTVTFEVPKLGQLLPSAWDCVGELRIVPIGLSRAELARLPGAAEWIDASWARGRLRGRPKGLHKGGAGRVLVVAGSREMPGAGYLSSQAALRAGAGLVTWALPEAAYRRIDLRYAEVILLPMPSDAGKFSDAVLPDLLRKAKDVQALAVGPGLGQGPKMGAWVADLLRKARPPAVVDADALNNLASRSPARRSLRGAIVTPHWLEFCRLSGVTMAELRRNPLESARRFARRQRCWVVLKGYRSVVASPAGKCWINASGGPNLATAGSGDVLTGVIAGLLAQGMSREAAATLGVYLHGRAGDRLVEKLGDRGTIASDIAKEIPGVMKEIIS